MNEKDNFESSNGKKNAKIKSEILQVLNDDTIVIRMTDRAERNALEILNCTKQDIIDISVENLNNDCDVESFPAKEKQYKGKLQHLIEPEIQDVGTGYIKF